MLYDAVFASFVLSLWVWCVSDITGHAEPWMTITLCRSDRIGTAATRMRTCRRAAQHWSGRRWQVSVKRALATRLSMRSEEHTSELQSLMRISYAVFCLKNKNKHNISLTTPMHNTTGTHTITQ